MAAPMASYPSQGRPVLLWRAAGRTDARIGGSVGPRSGRAGGSFAGIKSGPGGCGRGGSPGLNGVGCSAMASPPHLRAACVYLACEVRSPVVAQDRDYSPDIKNIDRLVILKRMISAPANHSRCPDC